MIERIEAFCCWSGGKESALSFYLSKGLGICITHLINMISEDGRHSRSHGINPELLRRQAELMKVPIIQQKASWENYEDEFKKAVSEIKGKGAHTGVFGDIDLQEHRDWIEKVCGEMEIQPILPLWGLKREDLLLKFIEAGFKAIVVTVDSEFLDEGWLGREINEEFITDLEKLGNIDLCGERGEYHTFVYDGPIFDRAIEFTMVKKIFRGKHWFLELILPSEGG